MDAVTLQPTGIQENPSSYEQLQLSAEEYTAENSTVFSPLLGTPDGLYYPQGQQMMQIPMHINIPNINCPPGLEYLMGVDQMIVDQRVELLEAFTNIECVNKYRITNCLNQQVYVATEESEFCERYCCKNKRGFVMHIWDNFGREVMRVVRPFQCCAGAHCCADINCCSLHIEVEAPAGQVVGRVQQTKSCMAVHFDVVSPDDDVVLKIRGPTCVLDGPCCTDDQDFEIFTADLQHNIGKISKKYGGFVREMWTNADTFHMCFPLNLDVKMKATLFGALFLIDFMFFEKRNG